MPRPDTDAIDALLPQTQCTRCGYAACRPYAEAVAGGAAALNRCVPGGAALIERLARLTGAQALPLDPACGTEAPARLAWIDREACIGCARCLPACPVDAIIGAARLMHTVIPSDCTGCELCLPACPVDCIDLAPPQGRWTASEQAAVKRRSLARKRRLAQPAYRSIAADPKAVIAAALARRKRP